MVSQRIENRVDENGRLSQIKIFKGSRLDLHLEFEWDSTGYVRATHILKGDLNKYAQLVVWILARFIERIGNIQNIENIGHIGQVHTSEALPNQIRNGSFETGDLTYWGQSGSVAIDNVNPYEGRYSAKLLGGATHGQITQLLPYVQGKDLTIRCRLRANPAAAAGAPNVLITVYYSGSYETQTVALNNTVWIGAYFKPTTTNRVYSIAIELDSANTTYAVNVDDILVTFDPSTKHDAATYKTAIFNAAADGDIVAAVANKKIKVHYLDIQAQGTVTVTIRNDDVAGTILDVWKFQDREGAVKAFLPYPASHYVTNQVAGDALYCDVSAAVTVKICVVYTDADAA